VTGGMPGEMKRAADEARRAEREIGAKDDRLPLVGGHAQIAQFGGRCCLGMASFRFACCVVRLPVKRLLRETGGKLQ